MEFIRVSEMLQVMEQKGEDTLPIPWAATIIKCNLKEQTGGVRMKVKDMVLVGGATGNGALRDQQHYKNFTRNFKSIHNNEIRQFHPLLVETFNGMRVIL